MLIQAFSSKCIYGVIHAGNFSMFT
uniref:Uncharacterized protein n=1 Tax=Rhizophora mucronata TaxID=61149 RepID=A0A2P2NQZ5_RHIMU